MFFTAVNPMDIREHWQTAFDLTKPRIALYRQKMEITARPRKVGQFEGYFEERTDVLSNEIKHDQSVHNSFSVLHRTSCNQEEGRSPLKPNVEFVSFTNKNQTETSWERKTNWYFKIGSKRIQG